MPMAREQLRQATHQRVLQAAERLFQDRGFAATTVRDIAAAADVSVGTVISVGDKRSLLVQVFDSKISAEHEQRPDVSGGHGDDSTCADRLELLVRPFVVVVALKTARLDGLVHPQKHHKIHKIRRSAAFMATLRIQKHTVVTLVARAASGQGDLASQALCVCLCARMGLKEL